MRLNDLEETVIDLANYQKQFEDGNTYNLTGKVAKKMKSNGYREQAEAMTYEVFRSTSYSEDLSVLSKYVEVY